MAILWTMAVPSGERSFGARRKPSSSFAPRQYAHAIALYQRRYANAFPPSIDVLVQQKFLRKKYKDPITGGDFRSAFSGGAPGASGLRHRKRGPRARLVSEAWALAPPARDRAYRPRRRRPKRFRPKQFRPERFGNRPRVAAPGPAGLGDRCGGLGPGREIRIRLVGPGRRADQPLGTPGPDRSRSVDRGGVAAVVSRSSAKSIRIFKNRQQYNQWIVTVEDVSRRVGARPHSRASPVSSPELPARRACRPHPAEHGRADFRRPEGPASSRIERGRLLGRRGRAGWPDGPRVRHGRRASTSAPSRRWSRASIVRCRPSCRE